MFAIELRTYLSSLSSLVDVKSDDSKDEVNKKVQFPRDAVLENFKINR